MFALSIAFVLLAAQYATSAPQAGTSLFVPGFDPQALSITELGVGSDGRTTFEIQAGTATDTDDDNDGFIGTATLVEGPNDIFLTYVDPDPQASLTLAESCALSNGVAACNVIAGGSTLLETETVSSIFLQSGATSNTATGVSATTTTPPSSSQGTSLSSTGTQKTSSQSGVSQTSSGSASSPSASTNAVVPRSSLPGGLFVIGFLASVAAMF